MKKMLTSLALLTGIVLAGCRNTVDEESTAQVVADGTMPPAAVAPQADDDDTEELIRIDQIPAAVKRAATAAVPGLVIHEAEKEVEDGFLLYCLEGTANGKEYEVEVTAEGKVVEIEEEDDD